MVMTEARKRYRENNLDKIKIQTKLLRQSNLASWEGFIPIELECEICGKAIYFNKKDRGKSVHFDHKSVKNSHIIPNNWLSDHKRTPENEKILLSFNFGFLCKRCNCFLPVENRGEILANLIKYLTKENTCLN